MALFVGGFVVVFQRDAREWTASTFLGCDGEVTTVHVDDGGESGLLYFCERDGRRRRIDLQLAALGFGPFVVLVLLPLGAYFVHRRFRR